MPCSRFIWITNSSDHRRVSTSNLLHAKQLTDGLVGQVTTSHARDSQFRLSCGHWNLSSNKSRARHHRIFKIGSKLKYLNEIRNLLSVKLSVLRYGRYSLSKKHLKSLSILNSEYITERLKTSSLSEMVVYLTFDVDLLMKLGFHKLKVSLLRLLEISQTLFYFT